MNQQAPHYLHKQSSAHPVSHTLSIDAGFSLTKSMLFSSSHSMMHSFHDSTLLFLWQSDVIMLQMEKHEKPQLICESCDLCELLRAMDLE